ncbi:MAG TPA: hypothetical protein VHL52_08440 [Acidimicrobiia bacterium]|nr:hypothetical protein [Acidimicrobiia bacterium]
MRIRKSIAILTVMTAMFTVACEADEDPGTDVGDVGVTTIAPGGDDLGGTTMPPAGDTTDTTVAGG